MPSDSETSMAWFPDQPLDFSTKARVRLFQPTQISPNAPKFHRLDNHHASSTTTDTTPLTMGFHRPMSRSPPPAPPPLPIHAYNFMDPGMLSMNDMYRPLFSSIGGLPSLPIPFLDNRRPPVKNMRPFKAYPRDPLTLPIGYCGLTSPLMPMDIQQGIMMNDGAYADFRKNFVRSSPSSPVQVCAEEKSTSQESEDNSDRDQQSVKDENSSNVVSSDSPASPTSNSNQYLGHSKRKIRTLPDELKDEAYWERRRKNNEAAKRSRDARRAKEDEIAIRAAFLEQENLKLRVEVAALKNETAKLRCLLYNSN